MRLRVATLNVWALPWPIGRLVGERMRAIGRALPSLDADVFALQEVWREDAQEALLAAGREHGHVHAWRPPGPARSGSGLLLLSRRPLAAVHFERYALRGLPQRVLHGDWLGHKGFVRVRLDTPDGPLSLVDTHLHAQYAPDRSDEYRPIRAGEAVQLAADLAERDEPVVALGDFNIQEGRPEYAVLVGLSGLRDAAAELDVRADTSRVAKPYNHGRPGPDSRIDYVFVRDGATRAVRPLRVERVLDEEIPVAGAPGAYSDHDGLVAELEIGPSGAAARRPDDGARGAALATAERLLAQGREQAEARRRDERLWSGGAALGAVLGLAGDRWEELSRRRWLRRAVGVAALACLPAGLGLLALSERSVPAELAAYDRVEALLGRWRPAAAPFR